MSLTNEGDNTEKSDQVTGKLSGLQCVGCGVVQRYSVNVKSSQWLLMLQLVGRKILSV